MFKIVIRDPLTQDEKGWFRVLEKSIEKSLAAFCEVGYALIKIRDNRLYREHFKTFDEYCRKRWNINRNYANKLIRASNVVDNLKYKDDEFDNDLGTIVPKYPNWQPRLTPIGVKNPNWQKLPTSESQVRPLTKLPQYQQKKAWRIAVESAGDKEVTARDVYRAVEKITDKEFEETSQSIKKRINQDEMVSENFKRAFMVFLSAIQEARDGGWKETSEAAVLNHIYLLKIAVKI